MHLFASRRIRDALSCTVKFAVVFDMLCFHFLYFDTGLCFEFLVTVRGLFAQNLKITVSALPSLSSRSQLLSTVREKIESRSQSQRQGWEGKETRLGLSSVIFRGRRVEGVATGLPPCIDEKFIPSLWIQIEPLRFNVARDTVSVWREKFRETREFEARETRVGRASVSISGPFVPQCGLHTLECFHFRKENAPDALETCSRVFE